MSVHEDLKLLDYAPRYGQRVLINPQLLASLGFYGSAQGRQGCLASAQPISPRDA